MTALSNLTAERLREAARIQTEIERLQARLEKLLSGGGRLGRPPKTEAAAAAPKKKRAKRKMSPEGRARIAEAQRKRWAKLKRNK